MRIFFLNPFQYIIKHHQHVALRAESDFESNASGALRQTIIFFLPILPVHCLIVTVIVTR